MNDHDRGDAPRGSSEAEAARLRAVRSYGAIDATRDAALDALVNVASKVCEAPMAIVTLVDENKQFFASSLGLGEVTETPREISFCTHAIRGSEIMIVEDATQDARFAENPFVVGGPRIRFYAGCPLVDKEGFALGTLCVLGPSARQLSVYQETILRELSAAVVRLLEIRRVDLAVEAAERAARSARTDLQTVLDAVTSTVAYWDRDLRNRFANEELKRVFGVSGTDIRGRHMREVMGEALFEKDRAPMEAALRGEAQKLERTVRDPAGVDRHFAVCFTPDVRGGEVLGFVATANEITELTNALVASEKSNALLVLAEEVAAIGHWRVTPDSEYVYWSPQVYRLYGVEPSCEPTLSAALAAFHPDDAEAISSALRRAMDEGEPFHVEGRLERADGIRRVEIRGRGELDPATGRPRAVIGVSQDVTDQHAMRDRLAGQQRLVTTGTLAAGVGHEINNPLTYVAANIEFAIDELRSVLRAAPSLRLAEVADVLEEARGGAERIRKIVRGLRSFAVESQPLGPTDVAAALEVATTMTAHELRSSARVIVELEGRPCVMADESRLSQVLGNMLLNAAQAFTASDPESNRIVVRTEAVSRGRIAILVEDNGPGIPPDVLPRIFDPFFTTKDVGLGTGLGLAICHSIVIAMGGELTCATTVGKGTAFRIVLAAARVDAPDAPLRTPAEATPPGLPRGRVLVVDDEPAVARTMVRALREQHDVRAVADPREALRLLLEKDAAYDVVFCDIAMPHMNGIELFERIRAARPALADAFVFVSGGARDESLEPFFATVRNERVAKPFPDNEWLRRLTRRYVTRRATSTPS